MTKFIRNMELSDTTKQWIIDMYRALGLPQRYESILFTPSIEAEKILPPLDLVIFDQYLLHVFKSCPVTSVIPTDLHKQLFENPVKTETAKTEQVTLDKPLVNTVKEEPKQYDLKSYLLKTINNRENLLKEESNQKCIETAKVLIDIISEELKRSVQSGKYLILAGDKTTYKIQLKIDVSDYKFKTPTLTPNEKQLIYKLLIEDFKQKDIELVSFEWSTLLYVDAIFQ